MWANPVGIMDRLVLVRRNQDVARLHVASAREASVQKELIDVNRTILLASRRREPSHCTQAVTAQKRQERGLR